MEDRTSGQKRYVIELLDNRRRQKEAEIREFIWNYWQRHRRGSLLVTSYSKEGIESNAQYILENDEDENEKWSMKVTVKRPDLKGTKNEQTEYRVYGGERIKPPLPEHPAIVPVPEGSNLCGDAYRLVFKDHEGKAIGRGSF
jgi:hypothetical protein